MNILKGLFGKQTKTAYVENDNLGTRHDMLDLATGYWMARMSSATKDPFVLYDFKTEAEARDALLDLPCIHVAEDSGKLICTETVIFGYYPTKEGTYEAVICGSDLSHDLWAAAKDSFIRHNGKPRGQGELEPEVRKPPAPAAKPARPGKVVFVNETRQQQMGITFIYRNHKGPDAVSAKAFLQQNRVTEPNYYIRVETPEGVFCQDIQGMYTE